MIRIYSKKDCQYCDKAKSYLKENDIKFEEIRVDINTDALKFLKEAGHKSVPQIYHDDKLIKGGWQGLAEADLNHLK